MAQLVVHQWQLAELSSIDQPLSLKSAPPYARQSLHSPDIPLCSPKADVGYFMP